MFMKQIMSFFEHINILITLGSVIAVIISTYYILQARFRSDLPRVGKPGLIGYLWAAVRCTIDSEKVLQEGWDEFAGRPFILPSLAGSAVIIGPGHVETLRTSDDTVFNRPVSLTETLQVNHTMNEKQLGNPYHVDVIQTDVTRAIASYIPDALEETQLAIQATFDPSNDSKPIRLSLLNTFTHMVARINNRTMLGTQLCRNNDFIHALVQFAETLVPYAQVLLWLPNMLRPPVHFILSSIFGGPKRPKKFLVPYIEQYLQDRETLNEDERPNSMVELLIRQSVETTAEDLAMRVVSVNFAGIHTTSMYLTHALIELSVLPKADLESIITEVQEALDAEGGWNKAALARFRKIDSLLKEVGRFHGLGVVGMDRLAIRDGVLDDGTRIPAGQTVAIYMRSIHYNPDLYPNPNVFDAFRFLRLREEEGSDIKHGFTTINNHYLAFGAGRHACPGRFFAAMTLKIIIANILLNYDFSLPPGVTEKPKHATLGTNIMPNLKAELVFRRKPRVGNF